MHKKTSMVIGLAIATILTASALTMSNQAFAQPPTPGQTIGNNELGFSPIFPVLGGISTGLGKFVLPSGGNPVTHPGLGQQGSHPGLGASQCPNLSPANQQTPSGTVGRCTSYYP